LGLCVILFKICVLNFIIKIAQYYIKSTVRENCKEEVKVMQHC